MKTKIISMLAVFGIVAGVSFNASANLSFTDWLQMLAKMGATKFCSKPMVINNINVRSFNGLNCKVKNVASLAIYTCMDQNYDEFNKTPCFKNAENILGKENISAKAKAILIEEAKKPGASELLKGLVGI